MSGNINLLNVTLVCVATTKQKEAIEALKYSMREISYGAVKLLSTLDDSNIDGIINIKINDFKSVGDWGKFIVFELYKYIDTDFIILIHPDGFIVNPQQWDNKFFDYDFIGAPWELPNDNYTNKDAYGNICRVGNSVSLRSMKLLSLPSKLGLEWSHFRLGYEHEDGYLCAQKKHILENHGIKYAPLDIAIKFSREYPIPENRGVEPFAFHKWIGENSKYPKFGEYKKISFKLQQFKKVFFRWLK
ncbi:DUF5672 family protein [Polynucleobacter sp. Nonnen-W13]|uniref:DUF5672 family protein n=1 Tax=Polynucleobacter sp. Nonnen-W13 TaxID=1855625 RepID=UPI001C0AAAB5|nr:DUF5672 family protein [Polynucleobacter sp. Nonnen-W13]MBU3558358.1 hypothetical protein [Polynucleobacter sp. Nonnen-W13]